MFICYFAYLNYLAIHLNLFLFFGEIHALRLLWYFNANFISTKSSFRVDFRYWIKEHFHLK